MQTIPKIIPKEYKSDVTGNFNGGLDLVNDPRQLLQDQSIDCNDIVYQPKGFAQAPGLVSFNTSPAFVAGATKVKAIGALNGRLYRLNLFTSSLIVTVDHSVGGSWFNTGYSKTGAENAGLVGQFVVGNGIKKTPNAYYIANTIATGSTLNSAKVNYTGGLVVNALVGKYIKVTNALSTVIGINLVTSNTVDEVFIEGEFNTAPLSGDVWDVYESEEQLYLAYGDVYRFYPIVTDGNVLAFDYGNSNQVFSIAWRKSRLYMGVQGGVQFSNLGIGNFSGKNNFIPCGGATSTPIVHALDDKLMILADDGRYILTGEGPDNYVLTRIMKKTASLDTFGYTQNVSSGTNSFFYYSEDGLEIAQSVETQQLENSIPISLPLSMKKFFGKYSKVETFQNRVYCFNSSVQDSLSPTTCYIYDIRQSLSNGYATWSKRTLPKGVTAVYYDENSQAPTGSTRKLFIGYDGMIAYFDENVATDWNANLIPKFTTPRQSQKDMTRKKRYVQGGFQYRVSGVGHIDIYTSLDGGTYTLKKSLNFSISTASPQILDIKPFLAGIAKDMSVRVECIWTDSPTVTDKIFESIQHTILYDYLPKPIL